MERIKRILGRLIVLGGIFMSLVYGIEIWESIKQKPCEVSINQRSNFRSCTYQKLSLGEERGLTNMVINPLDDENIIAFSKSTGMSVTDSVRKMVAEGKLFEGLYWEDVGTIAVIAYLMIFHGMFFGRFIPKMLAKLAA